MTVIDAPPVSADAVDAVRAALCCARAGDDVLIAGLISAAIVQAEHFIGRVLIDRECRQHLPFGAYEGTLEYSPVGRIVDIGWHIGDRAVQILQPDDYQLDWRADGSVRVRLLAAGLSGKGQAMIRFRAGRATDWESLSTLVRQGVLRLVSHWYRTGDAPEPVMMPDAVQTLWRGERRMRLR